MPERTRRSLLTSLGAAVATTAGCAALPAGPTHGTTLRRTSLLSIPDPGHPNPAPTDAHVLAIRAQLQNLVTESLPLYEDVTEKAVGERVHRDLRFGVEAPRDYLGETADEPASGDAFHAYQSRIPRAGNALGFLRSWFDQTDFAAAESRLDRARDEVRETAGTFEYRCNDPSSMLAQIGWAERHLYFADIADIGEVDLSENTSRKERAKAIGRVREHAEKMRRDVIDARYVYRGYVEDRAEDATAFVDALTRNRETLVTRAKSIAVDRETVRDEAERTDDRPLAALLFRLARAAGEGTEQQWHVDRHLKRGRDAFAAITAARAVAHYRSYRYARDRLDPEAVRGGPPAAVLFREKRRAVRAIEDRLSEEDPLLAWLLDEAARLAWAGDSKLENDWLESEAAEQAAAHAHYLRATGYARAASDVAGTLKRRQSTLAATATGGRRDQQ